MTPLAKLSSRRILVIAEPTDRGIPTTTTLSAITFAKRLSEELSTTWSLLELSPQSPGGTSVVCHFGAQAVLHCATQQIESPLPERYQADLLATIHQEQFDIVVAAATSFGKDLLPRLASAMNAAYVGDCIGFDCCRAEPTFLRPIYAGIAIAHCATNSRRVVISARASMFPPAAPNCSPCPIKAIDRIVPTNIGIEVRRLETAVRERPSLSEARVVVSGGRILGARFFELLGPLADELGGALGATRALCDAGHVPGDLQVGQTGQIVAPDLYIAVGISGSIQHLAGMRTSRTIVAINIDPLAPIFAHADFGIVGDLWQRVPELLAALRRRRGSAP